MDKLHVALVCMAIAAGLAGCATPNERADPDLSENTDGTTPTQPGTGGTDTGGGTDAGGSTPETISVGGTTYACDDTLDLDGVCDGYDRTEEGGAGASEVTADASGSIQVGGHTYTCEDTDNVDVSVGGPSTAGDCERYQRAE